MAPSPLLIPAGGKANIEEEKKVEALKRTVLENEELLANETEIQDYKYLTVCAIC